MTEALEITVTGIVQGVGFRPFVYRLAQKHGISGWVCNATDGVHIHAEGKDEALDQLVMDLSDNAPDAAQVKQIDITEVPVEGMSGFEIRMSDAAACGQSTLVSPDLALCDQCAAELLDPANRRFRYPFINCTNCGPRFTVIRDLPYDRANTSMAGFDLCPACAQEYSDPADRRFHAQPDACWECGPKLSFAYAGQDAVAWGRTRQESDDLLAQSVEMLRQGKIVAVKGLGGFHLCCDADNAQAVDSLRQRKHRDGKPLAVMMANMEAVRTVCHASAEEEKVLTGAQRPIVLLKKREDAQLAKGVADGLRELGVMLPYTPLQLLLMHDFVQAGGRMLVMTSGNIHDEPIQIDDDEARVRLACVADAFLGNDRPILSRFDDSVVRVLDFGQAGTAVQVVRRARGFAPAPIMLGQNVLPETTKDAEPSVIVAVGPEQKNTLCLLEGNRAFVSQHVGDLEDADTFDAWLQAKDRLEHLVNAQAQLVACDFHPEYLSSKWAAQQGLPRAQVQHHHAHIVSAMAEANVAGPVCGIAFDGTGFGLDDAIWGGEVLLANCSNFERFANFAYVPMPGGAAAVKNPLRMAYGVLWAYDLLEHEQAQRLVERMGQGAELLEGMIEQGINTPYTSSAGRLFDAVAGLLGVCEHPTYEGQPAVMLEAMAGCADDPDGQARDRYEISIVKNVATETSTAQDTSVVLLDAQGTFKAILDDMSAGISPATISARFHDALCTCVVSVARVVQALYGIDQVALAGGVFMNRRLVESVVPALAENGLTVIINKDMPPNDGAVSLGQAVVAWHAQNDEAEE